MKKPIICLLILVCFHAFAKDRNGAENEGNNSLEYTSGDNVGDKNYNSPFNYEALIIKINNLETEIHLLKEMISVSNAKIDRFLEISKDKIVKQADLILEDLSGTDEESYKKAYQAIINKEYSVATNLFNSFLIQYPHSSYLPNAYYWLGELYLRNRQYKNANKYFDTLISKYKHSTKIPSAMLKRAYGLLGLKKLDEAKQQLQKVVNNYPNTSVALIASKKLESLETN